MVRRRFDYIYDDQSEVENDIKHDYDMTMDINMQAVYEERSLPKESLHQLLLPQLKVDTL